MYFVSLKLPFLNSNYEQLLMATISKIVIHTYENIYPKNGLPILKEQRIPNVLIFDLSLFVYLCFLVLKNEITPPRL